MNTVISNQIVALVAVIEPAGVPALRIAFTTAMTIFLIGGILIFRSRHRFLIVTQMLNDVPVVRHNRMEEILFVWGGLTLVLIAILYQVWRA